jgi:hypothetical protein
MSLVAGIAALGLVWWLSKQFAGANPAALAKLLRTVGGTGLLVLAGIVLLRGRIDIAMIAGGLGFGLLRRNPLDWFKGGARKPGSVSRVRSAMIEAVLDHDTGRMSGTVLAGSFSGRALDELSEPDLLGVLSECASADPDGARLLESYLDRRFPAWREHAQAHADPGSGGGGLDAAEMSEDEAYQILGIQPGADRDTVRRAHRTLMKKFHPDQGGTTYLAARINAAKDFLLNRHR